MVESYSKREGGSEKRLELIERYEGLLDREGELTVGTFNVRTLAINGQNGFGHAEDNMEVCRQSQCGNIGL